MLKFPLAERITRKDGVVIKPARWSARDIARYMEVASKLGRLAAGMETDKTQVDMTSKGEQIGGITVLSDAELAAEIAELDARIAEIEGAEAGPTPGATEAGSTDEH